MTQSFKMRCIVGMMALGLLFTACNKPKDIYYTIPDADKAYFDFGVGSWWVYVNDSTGAVDTMRLESKRTYEQVEEDGQAIIHTETMELMYHSKAYPGGLGIQMSSSYACTGTAMYFRDPYGLWSSYVAEMPGYDCTFGGRFVLRSIGDSAIGGNVYSNLYSTVGLPTNLPSGAEEPVTCIVAQGVGLVHYHFGDSDTIWTLVNHQIK